MTERERDERDLAVLQAHENGTNKANLMSAFGVSRRYLNALLREAIYAQD